MAQLPKLPPNLLSLVNPNEQNELPAVYVQNPFPNGIDSLISGIDKNQNYGNRNLLNLETNTPKQDIISGLQKGLNFGIPEIAQAQRVSPYKFVANPDAENEMAPEQARQTGASEERPALLRGMQNVANGFQENAQNPFQISNLEEQKMSNGQSKGFTYRLGEGLGTVGRTLNSPTGRALLTAGIVGATGGNPTQAMTYGLQAGLGNYNNIQQDRMNRQLLQANGIDASGIRGYLNNDMTKNYTDNYNKLNNAAYRTNSLILRQQLGMLGDNTKRAGVIKDLLNSGTITPQEAQSQLQAFGIDAKISNVSNQTRNADVNVDLEPARKRAYELAPQIAMGQLGVAQNNSAINGGRLGLQQAEFEYKKTHPNDEKTQEQLGNLQNLNQDLQDFGKMFDTVPNPKAGPTYQAEVAKNKLRRNVMSLSPNEQAFETSRNNLKFRIITALDDAGKRVTNVEMNQIDKALPSLDMTYAQKQSAYNQLNRLITNKYGIKMGNMQSVPQRSGQTFKSGKYTVTVH